jgi:hypothetical protein
MTPKEKADELIGKCYDTFINDEDEHYTGTAWRLSKECALVTVNEIIESRKDDVAFNDTMWENASEYYKPNPMYLNYWIKVKESIEKL